MLDQRAAPGRQRSTRTPSCVMVRVCVKWVRGAMTRVERAAILAAQQDIRGAGSSSTGMGGMCAPCVRVLPITGVSISTLSGSIAAETVCASDAVAFRIDELQFDLGEGPCWEAFASHRPVLVPDLRGEAHPHWPVFGSAVRSTGACAMFAFPLYVGTTNIGSMSLYRTTTGPLDGGAVADAKALADTVAVHVLQRILAAAGQDDGGVPGSQSDPWQDSPHDRREIHQATGIVMNQLDLPVGAAFARLRGHAFAADDTMAAIAHDVVIGRLRLSVDTR